jgi:transcriptional regulator with XRE-family HTH domain
MAAPDETFGKILKRLRNQRDLTLRELATDLRITYAYLSQLEADLAKPSEDLARRIAQFFGEDEEKLLFLARDIPAQIQEIKDKFPNIAPTYFRRALKKEDKGR